MVVGWGDVTEECMRLTVMVWCSASQRYTLRTLLSVTSADWVVSSHSHALHTSTRETVRAVVVVMIGAIVPTGVEDKNGVAGVSAGGNGRGYARTTRLCSCWGRG